jgi:Spermine/spermidine synthase domain
VQQTTVQQTGARPSLSSPVAESNHYRVAVAVMLLSATGFSLQIVLTRIFSLLFQYHYVFLVVSLAVLGLGLGAALGYGAKQLHFVRDDARAIRLALLLLACILPLTAFLLSGLESANLTSVAVILSLLPFLLTGFCYALLYTQYAKASHILYGADLMGAALGLVGSLAILAVIGPFTTMLLGSVMVAFAALLLGEATTKVWLATISMAVLAVLTVTNYFTDFIGYHPERIVNAPPDKTMIHVLQNEALNPEVLESRWGAFARVDVVKIKNDAQRYVFTDGGAGSFMQRLESNVHISRYDWLEEEIPYLPFTLGSVDDTLIIGAGAGYDVFMAKYAGATNITAVEINPTIVEVTRAYKDYNGNILDDEGVTTVIADGRNFTERTEKTFDLIFLNNVYSQAAAPTNASLAENYTFTLQAFRAYWQRLNDDGRLAIIGHNGIEGVRLLMTALAMLEGEGLEPADALQHTSLVMSDPKRDPNVAPSVFVLSKSAWTPEASVAYAARVQTQGLVPLFIPRANETALGVLLNGSMTLNEYIKTNSDYNLFPTTDSRPFFYNLNPGLPSVLQTLLLVSTALVIIFLTVVSFIKVPKPARASSRLVFLTHFSLIGVGYILVEIALLKQFELLLGQPVLSLVVTLGALLLASSVGSFFAQRFTVARLPQVIGMLAFVVSLYLLALVFALPNLVNAALPFSLIGRCFITVLFVFPLGFFLGVPFPSALRVASDADNLSIPLLWASNALLSTLGAVLATVLGMLVGFQMVLLAAVIIYFLVASLCQFLWSRQTKQLAV